jgi:putative SOS response-associated peptidase YedK
MTEGSSCRGEKQRLPDNDQRHDRRGGRHAAAHPHALGLGAVVVVKAKQKLATFNARAETVAEKPMFRGAFKRTRCLIPVSGYYEWQDMPGGKQPWYFTARDARRH